jgi:mannitol-specific phosphotransferase system IIBC component
MDNYTDEELSEAFREVSSTISKCEKIQVKFAEGTSQYSLLRNRIKAMYVSKLLIENERSNKEQISRAQTDDKVKKLELDRINVMEQYTRAELTEALRPVVSIINKCEKGQGKFVAGTTHYRRFENLIKAMNISKVLIEDQLMLMK